MAAQPNGHGKKPSRLSAIVRQRCPRCLTGKVFQGLITMRETCPNCGLRFGREEGYFTGAMYVSYLIGMVLLFGIFLILWAFSSRSMTAMYVTLGVTTAIYLPLVPIVFRYSRVVWLHFDRRFGPEQDEDAAEPRFGRRRARP
jgi:uncharacterized protein (DUF983 family)